MASNGSAMRMSFTDAKSKAQTMRTKGKEFNKNLKSVYSKATSMHTYWIGKRYNDVVTEFNKMIPALNDMSKLVVDSIPQALESAANVIAIANNSENVTVHPEEASAITEIATYPEENNVLDIKPNNVQTIFNDINQLIKDANNNLNDIQNTFEKLDWTGSAHDDFEKQLKNLKNKIHTSLVNARDNFKNQINAATTDYESAQKAIMGKK